MKNTYIACTYKTKNDKMYSSVLTVEKSNNLVSVMNCQLQNGLITATICECKREANRITNAWNESYKKNDTYGVI